MFCTFIWRQSSSQHSDESGFAGAIFAQYHNDFRVGETALLNSQFELVEALLHRRILVVAQPLDFLFVQLPGRSKREQSFTKAQVFGRDESLEENVDA